jgi:hypothetical protein
VRAANLALLLVVCLPLACGRIGYEAGPDDDGDAVITCPAVCGGGCDDGTCTIVGDGFELGRTAIVCPPGLPCRVTCDSVAGCVVPIDCSQATRCEVVCAGDDSCHGGIVCGAGACSIECAGTFACGEIDCADAAGCAIACTGPGSCFSEVICCDAGACAIGCSGALSCDAPIVCDGGEPCNETC